MKKNKTRKGDASTRQLIINEAARLMYQEGVTQYYSAKHTAARRVLSGGGKVVSIRNPSHLPSNGEIADAVDALADFYEGEYRTTQLFTMRLLALELMQQLTLFSPRLIGSVSTGRIKKSSDIDIHVFTDDIELLQQHIKILGLHYTMGDVTITQSGRLKSYTHLYIEAQYPVELSVYANSEIRIRGRSSTDGKPIVRMSASGLIDVISDEHPQQWQHYLEHP